MATTLYRRLRLPDGRVIESTVEADVPTAGHKIVSRKVLRAFFDRLPGFGFCPVGFIPLDPNPSPPGDPEQDFPDA